MYLGKWIKILILGLKMMEMFYLLFFFQQQQLQHSQQQMQQIQQPPQHSPPQNTSPSSSQHTQPQAKQGGTHHLEQQPQPARPQTLSPHAESIWGSGTSSQASTCKCHSVSLCLYCSSLSKHSLGDEWSRCLKMLAGLVYLMAAMNRPAWYYMKMHVSDAYHL